MEDLGEDFKVDDDYSSTKQMSNVSWMLDKGIWLGKKAVITGAVISSAPLVLPPLVVFSALGLACSVPFGFVFATYACTQKIMSKLLPAAESSSVLEYNKDDIEVINLVQGAGPEEEAYDLEHVDLVQGAVEQENDDLLQQVDEQGYVEEGNDSVQRAEEQGYEEDEEEEVYLEQVPEEEQMKDTPAEVKEVDILQEKPIDTTGFVVTTIELDRRNDVLPEGAALSQEDVLYGQDGMQIYNEEPVEQEKLMLDVVTETGMKIVLDDAITSMDIHEQKPVAEEKQLEKVVKGDATILELNVNDIREPERGHGYQAHVYDGKTDFAVRKKESDEMKRDIPTRNVMDGEAKNGTQEGSTSLENEIFARKSLEGRPIKIIEHGHEQEYTKDTTKYIQVEDVQTVEGTEKRNEKPIIEDMNDKPLKGMRQVIVSVHGGKKIARELENEDIKECNKSQKLVLVARRVTDETSGDVKSVVERTTAGDLSSAREMADECGLDLFDYAADDHDPKNDFSISQGIHKPLIEDMNDKPLIGMRQVIVSVHGGKEIARELENEDIKECNKSQKLVLVARRVTDETSGDIKSVVERTTVGDLSSAREMADECGLDLFDYTADDHDPKNDFNISQENDNIRSSKTGDVADSPFLRVSTKVAVSRHINVQPETDPLMPSNKELLNEDKIWEQIDALRAIVGYSAPIHATSVEEIKALYIFTGVEPPSSLADNSDLVEMNEKLRLLKSVVGVK